MKHNLTLGSLFDGSGGFPLGGMLAGIIPVWASEIEPFPIRVTTKRIPNMKHLGDISRIRGDTIEPVSIITFGSPCTDMSVAGKRAGLDGSQSVLFYEAIRIIKEMRLATNGKYPRYCIWENVPGAFSSNKGKDFKAVLEAVISVVAPGTSVPIPENGKWAYADVYMGDEWSVAYRTLDAQYWGVPQRRKRIFLVADFNSTSAWKVLFKSEGLSGYSAESFRAWQRATGNTEKGVTAASLCLNDQGGSVMSVTEHRTATLRAMANHPPCVMDNYAGAFHINQRNEGIDLKNVSGALMANTSDQMQTFIAEKHAAGFCTEHSANARSIGFEEEKSPTLRAGTMPAAVALENHPTDSRIKVSDDGQIQTLTSRMGTGGNNVPLIMKIRAGCEGGGKGALIQTDKSATLSCNNDQTLFEPKVYGICSKDSNAMKSDNPNSGFYEAETSRTIDGNGGNPSCNQGGMAVVEGNGTRPSHRGDGYKDSDIMYTLNSVDRHAIAYGIDRAAFNQGKNAKYNIAVEKEIEPTIVAKGPGAVGQSIYHASKSSYQTRFSDDDVKDALVATDYKDPPVVEIDYIVRRLTPTECARLQGFPDWWCSSLETINPSEEEIARWREIFDTHRRVTSPEKKPKTDKQIIKWLKQPHSDSAEYKMWGNGVALPCVFFVLAGIAFYFDKS